MGSLPSLSTGRALLVAVAACAACAHLPLTCPARGGAAWIAVRSEHFQLHTDLPEVVARPTLESFERSHAALATLVFPAHPARTRTIDVVLFRDEEAFRDMAPAGAGGYFFPRRSDDPEAPPAIVLHGDSFDTIRHRFQHEMTHRFLREWAGPVPPWLEEGLAEYYSTLEVGPREAVVGVLPVRRLILSEVRPVPALWEQRMDWQVAPFEVPSAEALLATAHAAFHQADHEGIHYIASWILVHLLRHGPPPYPERFASFLDACARGEAPAAAWEARFADVRDALGRDLRRHVLRLELPAIRLPLPPRQPAFVEPGAHPLRDEEVHLLWARIRPWDRRENILKAGQDLAEALARAPDSPEAHFWMSLYLLKWRRFGEAERALASALARRPDEPRYREALDRLKAERAR